MIRHINLTDDEGQVYCHQKHAIIPIDGEHIAKSCWGCSYWSGMAKGWGVECTYEDGNIVKGVDEVSFSQPSDALSAAPPISKAMDEIASPVGIAARDARMMLSGDTDLGDAIVAQPDDSMVSALMQKAITASHLKSDTDAVVKAALEELDQIINS
jgi:hypothetical protein